MSTPNIRTSVHRVAAPGITIAALAAMLAACGDVKDNLLSAEDPDIIPPSAISTPEAADALRIGAIGRLRNMTAGSGQGDSPWMFSGLLTDEWKSGDTFLQRNETDQRTIQLNNANLNSVYRDIHRARNTAREALNALVQYKPTPDSNLGQMYFIIGFAELQLAEWMCNGQPLGETLGEVPEYGPPLTNQEIYTLALAHFDSALTHTAATDTATVTVRNSILIAKGRVLMNLGRYAEAATAVAAVPTNFRLLANFSLTTGNNNQIWSLNTSQKRWVVGDSFDTAGLIKNALPFASAKDPRLPATGTSTGTSPAGKSFDGATNFIRQDLFGRTDPTPVVSGIDARLIEAEAKIATSDFAGMTATLNALRASPQNLGVVTTPVMTPLTAPTTKDAALDLLFREKAFWTFSRGQRLGDLRRLVRQYGRTQDKVFPVGTFFKGGNYGTDVNFPVHVDETNNPQFTGCADRNA